MLAQTIGGFIAFFVVISALAYTVREPLERLGQSFVERFGLAGMAIGTMLADGLHFPVPPQFYLLAAITSPRPDAPAVVAVCVGSLLGGVIAFHVGRWLSHLPLLARLLERTRPRVDALLNRYGIGALAVASVTPLPFSFFCYVLGAYRVRYRLLAMLCAFRIPRLLAFYLLLRFGWSLG